jgi:HEPN domain-containing protein
MFGQRLIGKHHAEPEGGALRVLLRDTNANLRQEMAQQYRRVETGRASPQYLDAGHACHGPSQGAF